MTKCLEVGGEFLWVRAINVREKGLDRIKWEET